MQTCRTYKHNLPSLVVSCLLFCGGFCLASTNLKSSVKSVTDNQLKYVGSFGNCLLYLINFDGYDIDQSVLPQSIILLRYYSIANELQIFPIEFLNGKYNHNKSSVNIFDHKYISSVNYVNLLFEGKFLIEGRKTQCEVVIYLLCVLE